MLLSSIWIEPAMRAAFLVIPVLTLGACTVGPDFQPSRVPPATTYQATDEAVPATVSQGDGPGGEWWRSFGSPKLDQLVAEALANNRNLAASNATLAAAEAEARAVAGRQLPQIDANARVDRQQVNLAAFGFPTASSLTPGGNPSFPLYSVGGGVGYDFDLFGGLRRASERSLALADAERHKTEAAHLAIAGQVVNQVLTIAAIQSQIKNTTELLANDLRNIELTQKRQAGGEGTLVEVLSSQSQYAADRSALPLLDQQLSEARHLLATLLGRAPSDLGALDIDLSQVKLPSPIPVTLPSALIERRPDILQAEAELHAATATIGIATARLYPDITVGASITQGAPTIGDLVKSAFRGYDIFAGLTAPIFHGGTLKAQQAQAVSRARASQAMYEQTVLVAFGQVADLLSAVETDARSLNAQQGSVAISARSRHLSRRSFEVGNSDILQVLESERLYQQATKGLIEAQTRQLVNISRLYVATAGGWLETGKTPVPWPNTSK